MILSPSQIERQLRELLFDCAPEPYVVTDPFGRIELLNEAAVRFLGRPGVTPVILQSLMPSQDRQAFRHLINRAIPGDRLEFLTTLDLPQGQRIVEFLGAVRVDVEQGHRLFWVVRDVTDQKRAEQQARDENIELEHRVAERTQALQDALREVQLANSAKDHFLGLISHELRTPMTVILGQAVVLSRRMDMLPVDTRNEALNDIAEQAGRLNRLLENLMILAQLDSNGEYALEPVLLQRLLPSVIKDFGQRRPDRHVRVQILKDLPPVAAQPVYVEQIVINLLSNADKYSPPDESIEVSFQREGRSVRVSVADRGEGIDPAEHEAIFRPFYRTEAAHFAPGMGIGLAVCSRLVAVQAGRLGVEDREGGGSVFYFTLPMYKEPRNYREPRNGTHSPGSG